MSSKTDQNNSEWGNHYMWFRVDTSSWWSLAAALMWIEQTYFVEPQHRLATTLFFNPEAAGFVPFSLRVMAVMLNELMVAAGIIVATASVYDRYTWHSARVTLACQLRKLQYGWDRITSHLRHKSAESARIYGRLDAIGYADTADKASQGGRLGHSGGRSTGDRPGDKACRHAGRDCCHGSSGHRRRQAKREQRRGQERVQDTAEREALEELAAEAAAAKARAKRKSTKQAAQEGGTGQQETFDVGEDEDIEAHTSDSWGIVGRDVSIPNVAWRGELDDGRVAVCRVVGLAPRMYVVSTGGFHYTFTVAHMRIYLQTTENARLLQDLGGVAAIKRAPTTQAIGTLAKRKATSRRASTPTTRLMLASMFLLGLACGGQTADPGGSDDPMDDGLRVVRRRHMVMQSCWLPCRAGRIEQGHRWSLRHSYGVGEQGALRRLRIGFPGHYRAARQAAGAWLQLEHEPRSDVPQGHSLSGSQGGRWRRAIRHTWIRCSIGTNSGCIRRTGTTIRCSMTMLRQRLGEWSRRMRAVCLARKEEAHGTCAPTRTTIFHSCPRPSLGDVPSSLRMETSSTSG